MSDRTARHRHSPQAGCDPRYDGLDVYLPILDAFRPGDLVLTRNREGRDGAARAMSSAVAGITGGSFSHVLVCATPPTLIEAMPDGVASLSLARCFVHSLDNVRVLRHPDPVVAERAASAVLRQHGRLYSTTGAATSIASLLPPGGDRGIFCSALAALAYQVAGDTTVFTGLFLKTTPANIERAAGLDDVTASVFQRKLAPPNIEEASALDGDRRPGPSDRQTRFFLKAHAALLPGIDRLLLEHPGLGLAEPPGLTAVVEFVLDAVVAASKRPGDASLIARVEALDRQLGDMLASAEFASIAAEMVARDDAEMQRTLAESFKPDPDIDRDQLAGLHDVTGQQIRSRASVLGFLRRPELAASATAAAWRAQQELTLASLARREGIIREVQTRLGG